MGYGINHQIGGDARAAKSAEGAMARDLDRESRNKALAVAEGDYVMVHGRFSGGGRPTRIVVDILRIEGRRLAEHWDVVQDEATKAESKSGLPMFGETFPQ